MITVDYVLATFTDVELKAFDVPKLRGYFPRKYPDEPNFHNHMDPNNVSYQYPKIQYRIYNGNPALIGIGEGIQIVKSIILDDHDIKIDQRSMRVHEIQMEFVTADFGQTKSYQNYRYISPWMALNQENFKEYIKMNPIDQKKRLKQILKGNLLTISKAFGYTIPDFETIEVDGWFKPVERNFHNIPMQCFTGEFTTNFIIPDLLGLGKQCARGFGVVKRMKEKG